MQYMLVPSKKVNVNSGVEYAGSFGGLLIVWLMCSAEVPAPCPIAIRGPARRHLPSIPVRAC